jgi:signal transduction histidine kinase
VLDASINGAPESTAAWRFTIRPAFYETPGFYTAVAGLVLLVAWSSWRLRVSALRHQFGRIVEERARIARDIHDSVLQNMAGVALQLEGLTRKARIAPDQIGRDLKAISHDVKRHVAEARHVILDLRSPFADKPLPNALSELAEQVLAGTDIKLETDVSGNAMAYSREVEEQVLRIAGEALRNVVGHANASRIRLSLIYEREGTRLSIVDNGCGFAVDHHPIGTNGHWGMTGMRERANKIGAELRFISHAGAGTSVEIVVPRPAH